MEITKEQLLAHIQELQCRYVKYFNKYMTNISYGGKPSFCCFENLQAVKNYIRILKKSYSEYHFECTGTPGQDGECCTICELTNGQLTIDSVIVNGIIYNDPLTAPDYISPFINSVLNFNPVTMTWFPVLGDSASNYNYDCISNTLNIFTVPDESFINIQFNCLGTEAKGYSTIENDEGILETVIFNFSVTKNFTKDCSPTGCCKLSSLEGNTFVTYAVYNYFGPDAGYITLPSPEFDVFTFEFIENNQVNSYINGTYDGTYTYTYNSITGYLEITNDNAPLGYLNFSCSFDKLVWNIEVPVGDFGNILFTYYLELSTPPVNNTCSSSEVCKPVYSYCLQNSDIQNILDKSYAILSQYCNC
jgi:hypothetical protein